MSQLANFKPHANQLKVLRCKKRFRVVVAGRRFGKTVLSCAEAATFALLRPNARVWYIAPTYRQAKTIAWKVLLEMLPKKLAKTNFHDLEFHLTNGSEIALKGGEDPPSLKGVGLDFVILDEYADMSSEIWEAAIYPTLLDSGGHALFIGNPRGFNHFHLLAKRGDHKDEIEGQLETEYELDPNWETFRFTSYDNPIIEPKLVDDMKRSLPPLRFREEVLAHFVVFTGMIYEEFDEDVHLIKPLDLPFEWKRYGGIDFGLKHPTAHVWVAVSPDGSWFVYREYKGAGKATPHHVGTIRAMGGNEEMTVTWGDPSAAQLIQDYGSYGLHVTPASKSTGDSRSSFYASGIAKIAEKLKTIPGKNPPHDALPPREEYPSFFIFNTCPLLVKEFQTYRWKQKQVGGETIYTEQPIKLGDDLLDALRYFAGSYHQPVAAGEPLPWTQRIAKSRRRWGGIG